MILYGETIGRDQATHTSHTGKLCRPVVAAGGTSQSGDGKRQRSRSLDVRLSADLPLAPDVHGSSGAKIDDWPTHSAAWRPSALRRNSDVSSMLPFALREGVPRSVHRVHQTYEQRSAPGDVPLPSSPLPPVTMRTATPSAHPASTLASTPSFRASSVTSP